jgi:hypothetical protein
MIYDSDRDPFFLSQLTKKKSGGCLLSARVKGESSKNGIIVRTE